MSKNRKPSALIEHLEDRRLLAATPLPKITAHGVPTIVVTEEQPLTADVATFTDSIAEPLSNFTAKITWGELGAPVTDGVIRSDGTPTGFIVQGTNTYKIPSPVAGLGRPVTVKIFDSSLKVPATATSHIKVKDAPIDVNLVFLSDLTRNSLFQGTVATFTDADPTATTGPIATSDTASINWGDGSITPGTVTQDPNTKLFTVSGKHTYLVAASVRVVKTTIKDRGVTGIDSTGAPAVAAETFNIVNPFPVTSPSLIGVYTGTVKLNGIIGGFTGSHSFEFDVTDQTIDSITGAIKLDGSEIKSGTFPAGTLATGAQGGLLSNGNFIFMASGSGYSVTISGHITPDSQHITMGFIKATGSGIPIDLSAGFNLTKTG